MFKKVLIANRGEIAIRVVRACRDLGVRSVAACSAGDRLAPFTALADEWVEIPSEASVPYLDCDAIVKAAKSSGADAIHPGYGFLSENAAFAQSCEAAGLVFVGPGPSSIAVMGDKIGARNAMEAAGVPVVPGSGAIEDGQEAARVAREIGFPVLLKPSAGGGGIGMRVARNAQEVEAGFEIAKSTAARAFGNGDIFIERYVDSPRHIEIQVLGDVYGSVIHMGERECSIQRRHQKILEETPAPMLDEATRERMGEAAVRAAKAVGYVNAGTVEFVYSDGAYYFLEMNTRLQVEHPITEAVYSVDLVVEQLRLASGERLRWDQSEVRGHGHAIECRINAEDPERGFLPSPGTVTGYHEPGGPGVRVDSGLTGPGAVSPKYDSLIAKLIVWGESREVAVCRMRRALLEYVIRGVRTNVGFHLAVLESQDFIRGGCTTHFIDDHPELVATAKDWGERRRQFESLAGDHAGL